jgi:hypothetical protein
MKEKLLLMKISNGVEMETLRLLLTTDQSLSLADFVGVLELVIENIPNSTGSKNTPPSVIMVIDRVGQVDNKFIDFTSRPFLRRPGFRLKYITSMYGSTRGILPSVSKIDENTECNGKPSHFLHHTNAEVVV